MCPNSVFGTSVPSMKSALPMPVPSVSISTVPDLPAPAPGRVLQVLGAITAEMGSVERALSDGYEAVSILRLADSGPDASS